MTPKDDILKEIQSTFTLALHTRNPMIDHEDSKPEGQVNCNQGGGPEKLSSDEEDENPTVVDEAQSTPSTRPSGPKDIRYKVIYEDEYNTVVDRGPYLDVDPDATDLVKEDDDDGNSGSFDPEAGEVMDIITIVQVKVIEEETSGTPSMTRGTKRFKKISVDAKQMVIKSQPLIRALRKACIYHPGVDLDSPTISFYEPYIFLANYQDDIAQYVNEFEKTKARVGGKEEDEAKRLVHDFKVLKDYMDAKWAKKIEKEKERYARDPPVATYEMLWMLYKPGTRVFIYESGEYSGHVIRYCEFGKNFYGIGSWSLCFDGTTLDREENFLSLAAFKGESEIRELEIFPAVLKMGGKEVSLHPKLQKLLEDQGEKYWNIIQAIFIGGSAEVNYDSEMRIPDFSKSYTSPPSEIYKGRAIVDHKTYSTENRDDYGVNFVADHDRVYVDDLGNMPEEERGEFYSYQHISAVNWKKYNQVLDKGHFFLCSRVIGGFILKSREWRLLRVAGIEICSKDKDALSSLQIPKASLDMLIPLTHKYKEKEKLWSADFIQGKGEGQIFLLHGPPGVGKTYTAECISKFSGRPLLPLTVANFGTDESQVETELRKWFDLSERWDAIMLIDEADVYFERRSAGQLERNTLVSAFLRTMEYYRGILFLTTNRLGHIDDAILSRIHIVIEYTELGENDRIKIWKQFFSKLTADRSNYVVDDYIESFVENDEKISKLKWNGREIRNAFQTAVALAEYAAKTAERPKEKIIVTKKHIESVADMSAAFKKYMDRWKGDTARRAFMEGARMDESIIARKIKLDAAREDAKNSRLQARKD